MTAPLLSSVRRYLTLRQESADLLARMMDKPASLNGAANVYKCEVEAVVRGLRSALRDLQAQVEEKPLTDV